MRPALTDGAVVWLSKVLHGIMWMAAGLASVQRQAFLHITDAICSTPSVALDCCLAIPLRSITRRSLSVGLKSENLWQVNRPFSHCKITDNGGRCAGHDQVMTGLKIMPTPPGDMEWYTDGSV